MFSGSNGIGIKCTNIFSKCFKFDIGDSIRKKRYTQVCQNNLDVIHEPIINHNYDGPSFVEVSYLMDFERFGYKEYPDESFSLFAGYAADVGWCCRVPIFFNNIDISASSAYEYAKFYFPETNMIVHYEYPMEYLVRNKTKVNGKMIEEDVWAPVEFVEKKGIKVPKDPNVIPTSELVILDTPENGDIISFVNGIRTMNGGVHVNSAMKTFADAVLAKFNQGADKSLKLTASEVKRHFSIIISCKVMDPQFSGQTKEQLKSPTPKFTFYEKEIKPIENWNLMNRLYAQIEIKEFKTLTKSDGKKMRHLDIDDLQDANWAGSAAHSQDAILCLCEGLSSTGYLKILIGLLPGGRDKYGIFPLRGKSLNIMGKSITAISENREITNIKKVIGIREGLDYTDGANFKTLRYGGGIWICSDSDKDGCHIQGLLSLLFHCRYSSLIRMGKLIRLRTPIVRVKKGNIKHRFLTESSYLTWKEATPKSETFKHDYYKGLASSEKPEIKEDSQNLALVTLQYDEHICGNDGFSFQSKKSRSS